jgi:hypothetical protein
MKKHFISLLLLILLLPILNNVDSQTGVTTNGANIKIQSGTLLFVPGSIQISGNSGSILNNGDVYVGGDFTNNGSGLDASGIGTVIFDGLNNQNINGANSVTFYNVTKSTDSAVIIDLDETINNILTLITGSFDINGHTLTVNNGFAGTGNLKGSAFSNLIAGGSGTIYFDASVNYLKNFTLNRTANLALGNALNIVASDGTNTNTFGTISVDLGGTLDAAGNLTLKSDAKGDARVGVSAGRITGKVTVERYIPARRAWRFVSVPFNSADPQTINAAWQEGAVPNPNTTTQNNPYPGYGTEITYDNNTAHGFDVNITSNPSLKTWDNVNQTWSAAPFTNTTNMTDYPAYCLFIRGSRAIQLWQGTSAIPDNTVLRATGELNEPGIGNNSFIKTYNGNTGDLAFVGNPYASSVDIGPVLDNSSNISGTRKFWVWDPRANGLFGVGGYVSYSNNIHVPPDTSSNYNSGNIIQSGQAFFVQTSAGSSSMSFQEANKTPSEISVFSTPKDDQPLTPVIYTNLMIPEGNTTSLTDGVGAAFGDKFSASVDGDDAEKVWNFDENIALVRGTYALAIEFRPKPALTDTLFYRLYLRQEPYTLQIFTKDFSGMPLLRAWIVDKYLNTKTEINLNDTTLYNFTPNPDTNSYRNRFMLVFNRQFQATPMPVTRITNASNPNTTGVDDNSITSAASSVSVYPNPVIEIKNAMIKFNKMAKGDYEVIVYDAKGEKILSQKVQHDGGNNLYSLRSNASWAAGVYTITVSNEDSKKNTTLKLIISK